MATHIGGIEIVFGHPQQPKALSLDNPKARWKPQEFGTKKILLKAGHIRRRGCMPLPCDMIFDRDVPIVLRDGARIFVDVFRPANESVAVPALVAWSPYGKQPGLGNQVLDDFPFRFGVKLNKLSEFQKWEGPDPGYWVAHGYAIINPDPRGVGKSEGNIYQFGSQESQDGADVVEWTGSQPWCSGKVSLSGNSYLAISQWFIAAQRPKYLAAIAPWEGFSDVYRHFALQGGAPSKPAINFGLQLSQVNAGENSWENSTEMGKRHKIHNAYHADKAAIIENIEVPAYVVASWSNPVHVLGTFVSYARLKSDKWLRVHDTQEWPDYYDEMQRKDLHRFYDYYLKGIDNGWLSTPRVRAKIIDTASPYANTGYQVTMSSFPPPDTKPLRLFMDGSRASLSTSEPEPSICKYDALTSGCVFEYMFTEDVVCCGVIDCQLNVSLEGANDSNILVNIEKVLPSGSVGKQLIIPFQYWIQANILRFIEFTGLVPETKAAFHKGPSGRIRVGRRIEDTTYAVPHIPIPRMDIDNPVIEGEVVHLKIGMTPIGMLFKAGEALRVRVGGVDFSALPPVDRATLSVSEDEAPEYVNKGTVQIHTGGQDGNAQSFITMPIWHHGKKFLP